MKDVKKKKTTYKAVEFWGNTQANEVENDLNDWAAQKVGTSLRLNVTQGFGYWYLEYYNLKKERNEEVMFRDGDWIVVSSRGKVEIMNEDDYVGKYEDA